MTIDEAIELLDDARDRQYIKEPSEFGKALSLGIEALKAVKGCKICRYPCHMELLPGETEEVKVE